MYTELWDISHFPLKPPYREPWKQITRDPVIAAVMCVMDKQCSGVRGSVEVFDVCLLTYYTV